MSLENLDIVQPTTEQPQHTNKHKEVLYTIPVSKNRAFAHLENNTSFYDYKARKGLGILAEVSDSEFAGEANGEYILGDGWKCKWIHYNGKFVLKLFTKDQTKQRKLDNGIINFFVSRGLLKFYAVDLLKARLRFKFQLIDTLVTIVNNSGYITAFRKHPVYEEKYSKHLSREWVSKWCINIDLHDSGIFLDNNYQLLFELVKMVKVIDDSEKYRQELELSKRLKEEPQQEEKQ